MPEDYEARCTDCDTAWSGASDPDLLDLAAPDECPDCGTELETVLVD